MDDVKLYATTEHQLIHLLALTEQFSIDIHMEFGIPKCKIGSIIKEKFKDHEGNILQNNGDVITSMEENE